MVSDMAVSHDINVTLRTFQYSKATSANQTIDQKRRRTSTSRHVKQGTTVIDRNKTGMAIMKAALPFVAAYASVRGVQKGMRSYAGAMGTITNNRFRQQRLMDTADLLTPVSFVTGLTKDGITRHIEVMRENKRIDYNRSLYGNTMPYSDKSGGIVL